MSVETIPPWIRWKSFCEVFLASNGYFQGALKYTALASTNRVFSLMDPGLRMSVIFPFVSFSAHVLIFFLALNEFLFLNYTITFKKSGWCTSSGLLKFNLIKLGPKCLSYCPRKSETLLKLLSKNNRFTAFCKLTINLKNILIFFHNRLFTKMKACEFPAFSKTKMLNQFDLTMDEI